MHGMEINKVTLGIIYVLVFISHIFLMAEQVYGQINIDIHIQYADSIYENKSDTAFYLAKSAYLTADKSGDQLNLAKSALVLGKIMFYQGNYSSANEYLIEAGELFETLNQELQLAHSYIWLGAVHQYTKQYAIAYKYYRDALTKFKMLHDRNGIADAYSWIGHYYEKIEWYDSARIYQTKAFIIYRQSGNKSGMSSVLDNLGSIYEDLGLYDSAFYNFKQAYCINHELGNVSRQIINLNNIGDIYRKEGKFNQAIALTDSALQLSRQYNLQIQEKYALRDKSKIFQMMGEYDSAYHYSEIAYDLHAKILNNKILSRMAQLNSLYESQRQESKIEQLEQYRKNSTIFKLVIFIMGIFILVIFMLILNQVRLSRRSDFNNNFLSLLSASYKGMSKEDLENLQIKEKKLEKELTKARSDKQNLEKAMTLKDQALSTTMLEVISHKNLLDNLKESLVRLNKSDKNERTREIQRLIHLINSNRTDSEKWHEFQQIFTNVHVDFYENLKREFPELSPADLKLAALLKLNLNTSDIASILNISQDSLRVSRYRLRKKMNLDKSTNLVSYLMEC
jgi:tetratricopeptide (TPR) repeat protein